MFIISSVKTGDQDFVGTFEEAVKKAVKINEEYQPAFGVVVAGEDGEVLFDTTDHDPRFDGADRGL